jgi:hypothetical protein
VALISHVVFLRLVAEISDWFLQQRIDNKFCVKLGKNESDTYALVQCSPRIMGEKLRKGHVFLNGISCSKRARMSKSQMTTMLITFFDIRGIVQFEFIP